MGGLKTRRAVDGAMAISGLVDVGEKVCLKADARAITIRQ
jgi:hypothetical protein